jgi:hypothetical protein
MEQARWAKARELAGGWVIVLVAHSALEFLGLKL